MKKHFKKAILDYAWTDSDDSEEWYSFSALGKRKSAIVDGPDKKQSRPTVSTVFRIFSNKNMDICTETENHKIKNNSHKNTVESKEYSVLLDPGTSSSIISRHCIDNSQIKINNNNTRWGTPDGGIRTDKKVSVKF